MSKSLPGPGLPYHPYLLKITNINLPCRAMQSIVFENTIRDCSGVHGKLVRNGGVQLELYNKVHNHFNAI